ncbi:hypothetical protein [Roseixanthobacter pseudopolyaromaticivorans]|uniref:hypothetical protein n=1 Tax=Xanthobacteraceae TaxID=335928 RepID=UPI0037296939
MPKHSLAANATPMPPHTPSAVLLLEDAVQSIRRAARIAVHCEQTIEPEDELYVGIVGHVIRDIDRAADELVVAFYAAYAEMAAGRQEPAR